MNNSEEPVVNSAFDGGSGLLALAGIYGACLVTMGLPGLVVGFAIHQCIKEAPDSHTD